MITCSRHRAILTVLQFRTKPFGCMRRRGYHNISVLTIMAPIQVARKLSSGVPVWDSEAARCAARPERMLRARLINNKCSLVVPRRRRRCVDWRPLSLAVVDEGAPRTSFFSPSPAHGSAYRLRRNNCPAGIQRCHLSQTD